MKYDRRSSIETAIIVALIGAAIALAVALVTHRLTLWRTRRDEYVNAYSAFSVAFDYAIQQIKTEGTTLNLLILGEFPKHEAAMSVLVGRLQGKRRRRFQKKWTEYMGMYQEVKSMGPAWVAATAALISTPDSPTAPSDLQRYERERARTLFRIIDELLEIGKNKAWL
jgi:hypothetical protein